MCTEFWNCGLTLRWFWNSFVVAGVVILLVLVLSSTAGYALARIPFKERSVVYALVMAGLVIPEQAVFILFYTQFADWNLHNA
jgi:multiple sugar transport system permease protein